MDVAILKTAAEVREQARRVLERRNRLFKPAPARPPEPMIELPETVMSAPELPPALQTRNVFVLTAKHFDVRYLSLIGASRRRGIVHARHVAFFIAHRLGASLTRIAWIGHRDHTSVLWGCTRIEQQLAEGDERLAAAINAIGGSEPLRARWTPVEAGMPRVEQTNKGDR